jgi:septal ring factor EnvC (AmiA/AmiB activator)
MYNQQQIISQIQSTLQQMQSSEQSNGAQLRQFSNQLQQIAQHEASAVQQIQQLSHLCNQLSQEVQRTSQLVSQQQSWQPQVGMQQQPFRQPPVSLYSPVNQQH